MIGGLLGFGWPGVGADVGGCDARAVVAASCRPHGGSRTRLVTQASVFARVSPEQKLRFVAGLQKAGRVVAMTGDGANDAAAIRLADVGIGMAAHGSSSARTAADLVFTEPDVSLILDALVEGRTMWRPGPQQVLRTVTAPLAVLAGAVPPGPIPVAPGTGAPSRRGRHHRMAHRRPPRAWATSPCAAALPASRRHQRHQTPKEPRMTASDRPIHLSVSPADVDIPQTIGYYGGLEPPVALFIAAIPLVKMLGTPAAPAAVRFLGETLQGAAKPVGSDGESTIRLSEPHWARRRAKQQQEPAPQRS